MCDSKASIVSDSAGVFIHLRISVTFSGKFRCRGKDRGEKRTACLGKRKKKKKRKKKSLLYCDGFNLNDDCGFV